MTQTARMYGGSLYDLAVEENLTEVLFGQVQEIRQIFRENPDYLKLLSQPSIPKEERKGLIEKAFGASVERYLINFLKILCERGILNEYAGCCEEFIRRYNVSHNISEATVTSAVALDESQMQALKAKLETLSGKTIRLVQKKDPTVLGGLRVELDGKQLDGTVQGRLSGISRRLSEAVV